MSKIICMYHNLELKSGGNIYQYFCKNCGQTLFVSGKVSYPILNQDFKDLVN